MLFYPVLLLELDWKVFLLSTIIAPLLALLGIGYWLVESPHFLVSKGLRKASLGSLNYIADFNGKPRLSQSEFNPKCVSKQEELGNVGAEVWIKYLLSTFILALSQVCLNCIYYTSQFSLNQIGWSFGTNMLIIGSLEFIAYLLTNLYCHRMKRKRWLITFMLCSTAIGLLFQVLPQDDSLVSRDFETGLIGLSRVANTFAYAFSILFITEHFPSAFRATGTGTVQAISNLGSMVAPFLVTISEIAHLRSMFAGGIVCLIGTLPLFFTK